MENKLIDSHTHFFSYKFFELLAEQSPGKGADVAGQIDQVARQAGIEVPDASPEKHSERWLEEMDRNNVSRMVTFASLPEEAEVVGEVCRSIKGETLIPYTVVNPKSPKCEAFLNRAFGSWGIRGLVLFPAMNHYTVCEDVCRGVLEVADEKKAVVVVHCGILQVKLRDLFGLPRLADPTYSNPLSVVGAANRFPDVTFVIPHFGGGFFRETLMAGVQCENIVVDTSSSNSWISTSEAGLDLTQVFEKTLEVFGPSRILFGTDSSTFPRGWRKDIYESQKEALDSLGVSESDQGQIFGGNLARVLGK